MCRPSEDYLLYLSLESCIDDCERNITYLHGYLRKWWGANNATVKKISHQKKVEKCKFTYILPFKAYYIRTKPREVYLTDNIYGKG